jgi:2-methylcitrate dehydratase
VALLDGQVLPAQYRPERIVAADVQSLLRRVHVTPADDLSAAFPAEHACRLRITLRDGRVVERAKRDYFGFHTRPATWDSAAAKLASLAGDDMAELVDAVSVLDRIPVRDLTTILEKGRAS